MTEQPDSRSGAGEADRVVSELVAMNKLATAVQTAKKDDCFGSFGAEENLCQAAFSGRLSDALISAACEIERLRHAPAQPQQPDTRPYTSAPVESEAAADVSQPDTLAEGLEVVAWRSSSPPLHTCLSGWRFSSWDDGGEPLTSHVEATRQIEALRARVIAERQAGDAENALRLAAEVEAAMLRETLERASEALGGWTHGGLKSTCHAVKKEIDAALSQTMGKT